MEGDSQEIPRMLVRIRTLDQRQAGVLQRLIESGDDCEDEPLETNALRECLARHDQVRVLEICDFGTTGLDGETDPQSAISRFVKFFFDFRSEEHTSELQSLMRISYAVFCLKKKKNTYNTKTNNKV